VTFATTRPGRVATAPAVVATAFDHALPPVVPGPIQHAAMVIGELLGTLGILLLIPVAILAIGTPVVLSVRLVLWIVGLL
jgi:hypothetical protein